MKQLLPIFLFLSILTSQVLALTVKDLVQIEGEQENEISGQGLVVGLLGTGDKKNPLKDSMLKNFIENGGLDVSTFDTKNVALVNVSGKLSPHMGKGQAITLTVSTLGDAKSLVGGTLLPTKLHYAFSAGQEQTIFATAQGPLNIRAGQLDTVATIEGIVYTAVPSTILREGRMRLLLLKPNYVDADRIARQISQHFSKMAGHDKTAVAKTAGIIDVTVPEAFESQAVNFIAQMKQVPVLFTDVAPKIIINSRSNMVMLNEKVEVSPFAFAYKDLNVVVGDGPKRNPNVDSQYVQSVGQGAADKTDLQNLIDALNSMRVQPKDLVEIIQYAHRIGAIQAELIVE